MRDEFTKETIKLFGLRGSPMYEVEQKTTDLEDLGERIEQTAVPFCTCGASITSTAEVYRCYRCDAICCQRCHIELSRYNYCPSCTRQRFGLDKETFLSLVFLQHRLLDPDELIAVRTLGDEIIEIEVTDPAGSIVEHDYLDEDGTLSSAGKEALHVGHQLYGADADIQNVIDQIQLQEVVNRG